MKISIRKSIVSDLHVFYQNQVDDEANFMAAFTPKDPYNKEVYIEKWTKLMTDRSVNMQSIIVNEKVIGCVIKFVIGEEADITYALDKSFWSKGITSEAVNLFIQIEKTRPLYRRTAFDNIRSQRILEKNGFSQVSTNTDFANARNKEIKEFIYRLD